MAVLAGRNMPLFGKQGRLTILPETEFKLSIKGKFLLMGKKKKLAHFFRAEPKCKSCL